MISPKRRFYPLPALIFVVGVAGSLWLLLWSIQLKRQGIATDFAQVAGDRSSALIQRIQGDLLIPVNIRQLFDSSSDIDNRKFAIAIGPLLRRTPELEAVAWVRRTRDAQGRASLHIRNLEQKPGKAKGWDLQQMPDLDALIEETTATGRLGWINQDEPGKPGERNRWLIVLPVMMNAGHHSQDGASTDGVLLAQINLRELVHATFARLKRVGLDAVIYQGLPEENRPLTHWFSPTREGAYDPAREKAAAKYAVTRTVDLGLEKWTIYCRPAPAFLARYHWWKEGTIFFSGVALSSLLAIYLLRQRVDRDDLRRQYAAIKLLQNVAMASNEAVGREELLAEGLTLLCECLGWQFGHVWVPDEQNPKVLVSGGLFYMRDETHQQMREETLGKQFGPGEGIPGQVMATGKAMFIPDVWVRPDFLRAETAKVNGLRACIAFPVIVRQQVMAVLEVFHTEVYAPFEGWEELITSMGSQMAHALERQLAAEELRDKTGVFENAAEGIARLDAAGLYLSVNKAYAALCGSLAAEMTGTGAWEMVHPEDRPVFQAACEQMTREGRAEAQGRWVRPDGTVYFQEMTLVRDVNRWGQPRGGYLFSRDITQRKQAEEAILHARDAALESARLKSQFLANMSHEIRTPMNGIIGMLALLGRTALKPRQTEWLKLARTSADSLLRLLNDILDFSKIEAGKLELEPAVFDLRECVRQAMNMLAVNALQKGLLLNHEVDSGVPRHLIGDAGRLSQVLVNLINNGIKFTQQGLVYVAVSAKSWNGGAVLLHFEVHDSGPGVPREKQSLIFDAFQQADSSTTRAHGGTGLGLTICRQLAGLMGGQIWVESHDDEGSIFHFTARFPVAEAQSPTLESSPAGTGSAPARLRILLAEDNEINQRLAIELLEERGHRVMVAPDGAGAVRLFQEETFDLILMDIQMPRMDGYEATTIIRKLPGGQEIPIIAMTAHALPEDRRHCLEVGMNACLTKPLQIESFTATVERQGFQNSGAIPPAESAAAPPAQNPRFDRDEALHRALGRENLLRQMISLFLEHGTRDVRQMQAALDQANAEELARLAHHLRGSASTLRARSLQEILQQMETQCHRGDLEAVRQKWDLFSAEFDGLCEVLQKDSPSLEVAK